MLAYSILNTVGILVWLGYQFYWYYGCSIGLGNLIIVSLFLIFFYVAALVKLCNVEIFRKNATVFTVSLASSYIVYLTWTAIASHPSQECNPFTLSSGNTAMQIIVGLVFTCMTVLSIAMASASSADGGKEVTTSAGAGVIAEQVDNEAAAIDEEKALFPVTIQTLIFQIIMLLTCTYFAMLFTNWGDAVISGDNDGFYGAAMVSMWIKVVSLWFTLALFTVSITLVVCCPGRIL